MLTKQDLKAIKSVVRDEVVSEAETTKSNLRAEIKMSRIRIQEDISNLTGRVKNLEQKTDINNKYISQVDKKVDLVIKAFDREYLDLQKRVSRVETHLQFKPLADF